MFGFRRAKKRAERRAPPAAPVGIDKKNLEWDDVIRDSRGESRVRGSHGYGEAGGGYGSYYPGIPERAGNETPKKPPY